MRQLAWLHATPEKWDQSRAAKWAKEDGDEPRPEAELPPVDGGEHLIEYLLEVGPAPAGNPLTFGEIRAWEECTGVELDEFGATSLVALSRVYLSMLHEAKDPDCPWPAKRELTDTEKIAKSLRMKRRVKRETV